MTIEQKDRLWYVSCAVVMLFIVLLSTGCQSAKLAGDLAVCVTHPQDCN